MKNLPAKILWTLATAGSFISGFLGNSLAMISLMEMWWLTLVWGIVAASVVLMWLNKPTIAISLYFWAIIYYNIVYIIFLYVANGFGNHEIVYLIEAVFLFFLCIVPAIKLLSAKKTKGVKYAMILLIVSIVLCSLFSIAGMGAFLVTPPYAGAGLYICFYIFPVLAAVAIGLNNKSIKASAASQATEANDRISETEQK